MSQLLEIHPTHPQPRMIRVVADVVRQGGVVVYPTDTAYALGCHLGDKTALERIVALRKLPKHHQFTLACRDLSELGTYARVDNMGYRLLRRATPGPYTFILKATREVPKRLLHIKRRTIGLRVPDHAIARAMLEMLGEPMLTTTVRLPDQTEPMEDARAIFDLIGKRVDVVVDSGERSRGVSTVIDLTGVEPEVIREGIGAIP